jgi:hypothetical protein
VSATKLTAAALFLMAVSVAVHGDPAPDDPPTAAQKQAIKPAAKAAWARCHPYSGPAPSAHCNDDLGKCQRTYVGSDGVTYSKADPFLKCLEAVGRTP